jgi:hypothetical protein
MTHISTSTEFNLTTENQSRRPQEISIYSNIDYLDPQSKSAIAALSKEKTDKDHLVTEGLHMHTQQETNSQEEIEKEKDLSEEFNMYKEKINFLKAQKQNDFLRESLPRFGLSEKETQTLLTSRDLEELEALRVAPPKDLMLSLLKTSPDFIKKIYGVNLNSVFASAAANNFYFNHEKNFIENCKNFSNSNSARENKPGKCSGPARKGFALSKKAGKNLLLQAQDKEESFQQMISRKRKFPVDYSDFNKNGVYDKSLSLELKPLKAKEKSEFYSKSFNLDEDARLFFASLADPNFDFAAVNNKKNINNIVSFNDYDFEKSGIAANITSHNKIFIKRKIDNRRKNKFKNAHVPYLHFSNKLLRQEKSERSAKNGSAAKSKKLNKNIDKEEATNNNNNIDNDDNNTPNNIFNNNPINKNEENIDLSLFKISSNSKTRTPKILNLNESKEPFFSNRERGRPSKKSLLLESLLNSQKNSTSNLVEKVKISGNATAANENFFSSVNEDYSKSSYDASYAKFGVSSSLNENEDLNDMNNPLIKDFNNEIDILNETESKFGRGKGSKNAAARVKVNFSYRFFYLKATIFIFSFKYS